jgi:mannose-1-phosphate guanylyltransferase
MVVETCRRLAGLAGDEELILVISREHEEETRRLFAGRGVHVLSEPVGRNTAPCIGLGALYALHAGAKGAIAFLPADHFIFDSGAFVDALRQAGSLAESGAIVTLGIVPSKPETGYGYIRREEENIGTEAAPAYRVSGFVEKPDIDTAKKYLTQGDYFWNAGIFVATAETILSEVEIHLPGLHGGLSRLKTEMGTEGFGREVEDVYGKIESVSFDYGIMEKTKYPVVVVPCQCGWSDVGSWASLRDLRQDEQDGAGNLSEGDCLLIGCRDAYVSSKGGKLIACLGLNNCLVVDTPDALLVADLERSQDIRKITEELKKEGRDELL